MTCAYKLELILEPEEAKEEMKEEDIEKTVTKRNIEASDKKVDDPDNVDSICEMSNANVTGINVLDIEHCPSQISLSYMVEKTNVDEHTNF
jgi:hypothetical protein